MMWWSVMPSTSTPAASRRAFAARSASIESTRKAMWLTHSGVFGDGAAATLSPRSKKARCEPSVMRKKMCTYGQCSPVLGTMSERITWTSGRPSTSS